MVEEVAREEQLKLIQDNRVYPVGRVLRDTFDAENHDTLGSDVAGLMINLSRVPYEPPAGTGAQIYSFEAARPNETQAAALRRRQAGQPGLAGDKQPAERIGLLKRLQRMLLGRR